MDELRVLPPVVPTATAPDFFSPSQVAFGHECLLRLVLMGEKRAPRLISHPAAEIGTVFHRLLEMSACGQVHREGDLESDLQRTLAALIGDAEARLASQTGKGEPISLRSTVPPLIWRRKVRRLIDTATRVYSPGGRSGHPGTRAKVTAFEELPEEGVWSEVSIRAPSLRMAGRMDLVQRSPGHTIIKDLKTGRVLDDEGSVLPKIQTQLRVYGLMVLELKGSQALDLLVDDGVEHIVPFDAAVAAQTRDQIGEFTTALPTGKEFASADLAKVGDWCGACAFRHVCPTYREVAPTLWAKSPFSLAPDIWGCVEKVERPASATTIALRDDAGRSVRIFGLNTSVANAVNLGQRVWFFGLHPQPALKLGSQYIHPVNFFATLPSTIPQTAWSLEILREP